MNKLQFVFLFIIISSISISCDNKGTVNYANVNEKAVIDQMSCWNSVYAEYKFKSALFETDEKKKQELIDEHFKLLEKTNQFGRKGLYNDTIFINCIRSDSVYKSLLSERKKWAFALLKYKKKVLLFKKNIVDISKNIVKYDYYSSILGIKRESYVPKSFFETEQFYKGTVDLFKEAYTQESRSKITDKEIASISDLLTKIESIDKHIWCVPDYILIRNKLEVEATKQKQEQDKARKFDSLNNKK